MNEPEKIEPRTGKRFVVLVAIYGLLYILLGQDGREFVLMISGGAALAMVFFALGDPCWFMGTTLRPLYRYHKKKYYDLWKATSEPHPDDKYID